MPDNAKPDGSIVILAGRSELSYLLINYLAQRFHIACVVFDRAHTGKMLSYRLRVLGTWVVFHQLLFLVWDRVYIRRQSRGNILRLLRGHDTSPPDGRLQTIDVDSINSAEVRALVDKYKPDAVVVSGTGIIGKRLLALVPTFINIHCGITPRYRGVHGAFWAVVEGQPERAGTTVHLVDPGVDTGAILGQAIIWVEPDDTYRTLPVKQYLAGLDLVANAVNDALTGQLKPFQRSDLESRQWYSPTLWDYWRFTRNRGKAAAQKRGSDTSGT